MQKDLEYLKSKDKELEKIVETKNRAVENYSDAGTFSNKVMDSCEESQNVDTDKSNMPSEEELLSSDMRRELLRKQWEKEEEELRNKSDIHYQDVLFGGKYIFTVISINVVHLYFLFAFFSYLRKFFFIELNILVIT